MVRGKNMAMTSEAVLAMARKLNESKEEVIPETEPKEEIQPSEVETNDISDDNNDNVSDESATQEIVDESSKESAPANKVQHTKQEQEAYAFAKLKNKEKQKREKLAAEYEAKIKNLTDELEKFKGLHKEDFKNDEEYIEHLVNRRLKEQEANQLKMATANLEAEAFDEINTQRINNCFPNEEDRVTYNKLVETSGAKFVELLSSVDPENAVLSYLDDSDISPLLIRVLMTKSDLRNEVLSKKSPYGKTLALDNLAKRLSYAKSIVDKKRNSKEEKPINNNKMPVVGKVAKTESPAAIDKNDPNYWNLKLKELNQLRGR